MDLNGARTLPVTPRRWLRSTPTVPGRAPIPASQITTNEYYGLDVRAGKSCPVSGDRKVDVIGQVFRSKEIRGDTRLVDGFRPEGFRP